ncbi:hypothetical protein BCF59_0002 [Mycoplasmopsis mustelae]|uniref:Lipoprotein n=1 Tax=Mycoplasmopsis mustelae TaxID=171289 RepID=A0A4R7UCB9_9BACT|nr:hypothetical protein [Mycoplasmopsis mustelae]TDV24058.1 hypothetical protein BCF59_0002 [Mycoplasmopsis mustelae]
MFRKRFWFLSIISVFTASLSVSCSALGNKEEQENKATTIEEERTTLNFSALINEYQDATKIIKTDNTFGYYWSYIWNTQNKKIFDKSYKVFSNGDELEQEFLSKFTRQLFVDAYNSKKYNFGFDIRNMDELAIQKMLREEFSKIYLNNQDFDSFFKEHDLILTQFWFNKADYNLFNKKYIILNPNNSDSRRLVFEIVRPNDLYYVDSNINLINDSNSLITNLPITGVIIKKTQKYFIDENPTRSEIKQLFKYLFINSKYA